MELYSIPTGNFKLDGGAMFGVVPKSMWNKVYPSDENNLIPLSMRCLLIVEGDRRILVDNGIGSKQEDKFFSHYFLHGEETLDSSLAAVGYSRNDITDMFLTHLHFDHAGGSIRRSPEGDGFEPAFPNADYWVSRVQWEWATSPNAREKASFLKENILPIAETGRLKLFDSDFLLIPGVEIRIYNGHTMGQAIPFIQYQGRTVVYMADTIPTSAHIPLPYIMSYDTQPLISLQEKEEFLKEAVKGRYILFFEHDYFFECCTAEQTERGFKADSKGSLQEIFLK
ncbi:MAG: MBL fold metallo-hydrolase [Bacteroidales bacterium]|nr:MBL fold metallo-hydrolase [Bacteroidales bacterium]